MRFLLSLSLASIFLIFSNSCKEKSRKYFDQGEIHYSINYLPNDSSVFKGMKPKNLVVSFKNDKILYEIMSPIGNIGIINVLNPEAKIYNSYINYLSGKKYYYEAQPGELFPGFEEMKGIEIHKTLRKTLIGGYKCKNAEVTVQNDRSKIYNIWYTDEIKISNSNASTPFSEIDGTLINFFFLLGKSEIHFEFQNIINKEIPDKVFEAREKYTKVSMDNSNMLVNKLLSL
jgi:hypothetical protein